MTHFSVTVIYNPRTQNLDDILERYDENKEVEPYRKYTRDEAINRFNETIAERIRSATIQRYLSNPDHSDFTERELEYCKFWIDALSWDNDAKYFQIADSFDPELREENGDLMSTYNPDSKWDWWTNDYGRDIIFSSRFSEFVQSEEISKISVEESETPIAFIDDKGEWHERGEVGWFGTIYDEKPYDEWETEYKSYLKELQSREDAKDYIICAIDCHI